MTTYDRGNYRTAFIEYLRKGTPLRLAFKQTGPTEAYVWRTRRDAKVRVEHRRNDGQLFRWDDEPPTGHPGTDFNCRCEAVPYIQGQTEFASHEFTSDLSSAPYRWTNLNFVAHYYFGNGAPVTLAEIGHLREIAEYYAYETLGDGAFRRLSDQIASAARLSGAGAVSLSFGRWYDFGAVEFSHGDGTVSGSFSGMVTQNGGTYAINGWGEFVFSDEFADPLGLGVEPGGKPYSISGTWTASFSAEVFREERLSNYYVRTPTDD